MPMTNAAEYLERTAARVPDKVAFSDASGSLTFGQLLQDARALGTVLAGLPGCKNAPVAVLTGRTVQSVAALQGVLQSGNYYVPIDEQMPEAPAFKEIKNTFTFSFWLKSSTNSTLSLTFVFPVNL